MAFASHKIECCSANEPTDVYAADLDGDNDLDVLFASSRGGRIAWHENTDGQGTFGQPRVITTQNVWTSFRSVSVHVADLDGDGDLDVLSASLRDGRIAWYENTDGQGTFGDQQVITNQADRASDIYAADLDGDGDTDVLSASQRFDRIAWYENTDGQGTFGHQQVITDQARGAQSVYVADLDDDGDADVLSASEDDDRIAWYENTDGKGTFGQQQVISTQADGAQSVYSADLDGDGDTDVLSASEHDDKIAWYENTDGQGTFGQQQIITTDADGALSVYSADLDGDGDLDVLYASERDDTIAWYENTDGQATFGQQQVVAIDAGLARSIYAADLDGDGDMDVLSASSGDDGIAWYENIDGQGTFGNQHVITAQARGANSVHAADLDSDGDLDVLFSASPSDVVDVIAWYENTDGQGTFGNQHVITSHAERGTSVYAADLDGDGDLDVLSTSMRNDIIAWYENTDGQGTFGSQQVITTQAGLPFSVNAADLDGDGDLDALSSSYSEIAWYENTDGLGSFGDRQVISSQVHEADYACAADLDGDGDLDTISSAHGKIAWYENTDGLGTFTRQQVITPRALGPKAIYATDLDGDGDIDLLSASSMTDDHNIAWYENTDAQGDFGKQQVITNEAYGAQSVHAADFDGDGDLDVLSASGRDGRIAWHENRLVGDANDDGVFNSSDLVLVLQAGEYEDRGRYNSTYDEGDWNGDGDFDSSDLVRAFQVGHYENAAGATSASLAAAVDWLSAHHAVTGKCLTCVT